MAGPFYVDISAPGSWQGRTGLDSTTNCWLGITGLQKAFDTVAAGEICYVKGATSDASKFYSLPFDTEEGGHLTDGEVVSWDSGEWTDGTTGTGVVHWTGADMVTPIELELLTGTAPGNDDELKGATSGRFITVNGTPAQKTIDVNTLAGTNAAGFISFIGVDASWNQVGGTTRAYIDFKGSPVHGLTFNATAQMYWLENIEVDQCGAGGDTKHGFYFSATDSQGCHLLNCSAHNCSGSGFQCDEMAWSFIVQCVSYSNTQYGFTLGSYNKILFSCAYGNTSIGMLCGGFCTDFIGCVSHGNHSGIGLYPTACLVLNCVTDGNTYWGIYVYAYTALRQVLALGNRVTNQVGAESVGLLCNDENVITGWNYFENNYGNNIQGDGVHRHIHLAGGTTTSNKNETTDDDTDDDYGYVSSSGHNFSTKYVSPTDPQLRRTAITVPWT